MPPSRPYIPSAAVLRALSHPAAPICSCFPRFPAQFIRGKGKLAKPKVDEEARMARRDKLITRRILDKARKLGTEQTLRMAERPALPTDTMSEMGLPEIQYWEQDLDKPGRPMTLIAKMATRADLEKQEKIHAMREERERNPDYDDAELNRILMDEMIANPNFADLTEQLQFLKSLIKTKEEKAELERKANEENEPLEKKIDAMVSMQTDQSLQELLDDPDLAEYHQDVRDVKDKISEEGTDTPEFTSIMEDLDAKLQGSEVYRKKAEKWKEGAAEDSSEMEEWREFEALLDAKDEKLDDLDEFDLNMDDTKEDLLIPMRELLSTMNDDKSKAIVREIDDLLKEFRENPIVEEESPEDEEMFQELDYDFVVNEIKKIQENPPPESSSSDTDSIDTEAHDPELEAKVDQIMEDPELLEKLAYMTQKIKKQKRSLTNPDIESPPDPLTLSDSETSTLAERLAIAENDPEHIAAMRRLRIKLTRPFNASPALRSLNQSLKFAYCCSNDTVRRLLWRSYFKARSLPTLLQNMPDDAWDMMYYSQAVKWVGNENREDHLKIILQDLSSVGRDGPPTHPSTLKKGARQNDEEDGYI